MLVYKFGGASVKNAKAVEQLKKIITDSSDNLILVISAMGKTTNHLEAILAGSLKNNGSHIPLISQLNTFHIQLAKELMYADHPILKEIEAIFNEITEFCNNLDLKGYNYAYDQIVSFGEILSTKIISEYLQYKKIGKYVH